MKNARYDRKSYLALLSVFNRQSFCLSGFKTNTKLAVTTCSSEFFQK